MVLKPLAAFRAAINQAYLADENEIGGECLCQNAG
jgi:hypothetical protein